MEAQPTTSPHGRRWTAAQLRVLPAAERDAILAAAAELAAADHSGDQELTDFNAFDAGDFPLRRPSP
jgi:hypothetical protein